MSSTPKRAFSLVEVAVSMGLLLGLLGSLYLLMLAGMRFFQQGEVSQTVQQQAGLGLRRLNDDLSMSNLATVTYGAGPDHVFFLSPLKTSDQPDYRIYTYDGSGNLEWHTWIGYILNANGDLVRTEVDLGGATLVPPVPAVPPLATFTASPINRVVARKVSSLVVAPGATAQTLRIDLTVSVATASDKRTELTLG
ncbi:MAG: hypothetical protein KC910_31955, partial [Candidatus Eremiobacteraeota bacterium]|nr:hypothetical protein [Candidatus Eremiobacteraeota bacterium]